MVWVGVLLFLQIINAVLGDVNQWTRTKPVTICSGHDQDIQFVYNESFNKYSAVTWSFKPDFIVLQTPYVGYYSNNNPEKGLQIAARNAERYTNRTKWIDKTLSFTLLNVSTNDSGVYDVSFSVINSHSINSKTDNSSFRLHVKDPCISDKKVVDGCTELTCSTQENNPQYSWTGDAESETKATVKVCPKQETEYRCCVDEQKTKCMAFQVAADVPNVDVSSVPNVNVTNVNNSDDKDSDSDNKTGIIVGVVIAVVAVVAIVVVFFYCRSRGGYAAARTSD